MTLFIKLRILISNSLGSINLFLLFSSKFIFFEFSLASFFCPELLSLNYVSLIGDLKKPTRKPLII